MKGLFFMYLRKLLSLLLALNISSFLLSGCTIHNSDKTHNTSTSPPTTLSYSNEDNISYEDAKPYNESEIDAIDLNETDSKTNNRSENMNISIMKNLKTRGNTNPVITQDFGADPYAMVYDDTVYLYMTADALEFDKSGEPIENTYSQIKTIRVVSTKDMKNFTDHGFINVAGKDGIAKWASNSWAPAACHKKINGKEQFFLYFADNGGGIGVLRADSPVGPFEDPLGHGLITRNTTGCSDVLWLFDPAVLVDDDGTGYIYFGGGVPEGKISNPGTARVAKLSQDMISLDSDPVVIDAPYIFEDSGIHKYNNKYYYSYCTNWNVDDEGTKKYGFTNAEIVTLESSSPTGPFTYKEVVLANPGSLCGLYGNNHHCIFSFKDKWYITYHSRALEKKMNIEHGYRNTNINEFEISEDGSIGKIIQNYEGPDQLLYINPLDVNNSTCVASMTGANTIPAPENTLPGKMDLIVNESGGYIEIDGVEFASSVSKIYITANVPSGVNGTIHIRTDFVSGSDIATIDINETTGFSELSCQIPSENASKLSGVQFLYFVFEGEGYCIRDWHFE